MTGEFFGIRENIYGSEKRLRWICSHVSRQDTILEVGCGTGAMITLPLLQSGYKVYGIDEDEKSIDYGRQLLAGAGFKPEHLLLRDLRNISETDVKPDVIIASEVLEHIPEPQLSEALASLQKRLRPGGKFLVTVPNGYGWFEWESFLWYKAKLGIVLKYTLIEKTVHWLKARLLGRDFLLPHPSTLSDSPHVQRFTFDSIQKLLVKHGFEIQKTVGSVFFCGPFSDLFLTGFKRAMALNANLGSKFCRRAAGFFICAKRPDAS